ncbi:MAG: hypothetical protein LBE59_04540, partial [Nevskiaceae bacterium]|nr:hypothetical protein [Nevskiaceae bacterium]
GAQTREDAQRFGRLGARDVDVSGNLKFDFPLPPDIDARGAALRTRHAPNRPLWVAGSTHPGEEDQVIQAQRLLCEHTASASAQAIAVPTPTSPPLLVMAPRHPERFNAVAAWLEGQNIPFQRRSTLTADEPVAPQTRVLLLDTLGELLVWYAACDAAFVGGSLTPVGGHNLLEPAALSRPVLTGPYSFNSPEAARLLEAADALLCVTDAGSLADAIAALLADPPRAQARGERAASAVKANQGAAQRSVQALERLLLPGNAAPR